MAKIGGERGHPCRMPLVASVCLLARKRILWQKLIVTVVTWEGAPKAVRASRVPCRAMARKSRREVVEKTSGSLRTRANMCERWSISTTFASVDRLGRKPLWFWQARVPANRFYLSRQAPAVILLSVLDIARSLVFPRFPSGVVFVVFL